MTPADPARTPLTRDAVESVPAVSSNDPRGLAPPPSPTADLVAADVPATHPGAADIPAIHPAGGDLPAAGLVAVGLPAAPLVLYDGNCGLCARSVRFILEHERDHDILFAPLQGPTAARARERHPRIPQSVDSVVFIHGGRAHLRSKAMLHAASHLRAPWRWAHAMRWFPGALLDLAYRVVAAMRHRIWGHADACRLATSDQRRRFLP